MSKNAYHKKNGLKLGIIAFFLLMPFLCSYAENSDNAAKTGAISLTKSNQPSESTKPDKAKDVKQIQTLLTLLKFNPGPIDGILGKRTTKAIRDFQLDIGVPVTGKIDENLKSQLDKAYRLVVIRNKGLDRGTDEKPQKIEEKPIAAASQDTKPFSAPEREIELETGKEPEAEQQKEIETERQKELTSKGQDLKTENQYIKYIKISFPIVAVIFLAYFYRIWTRSHEKKRDEKKPPPAELLTEQVEIARPEEEYEKVMGDQAPDKEPTDIKEGKAELDRQEPIDYQDPSHPGYIAPVVRRKVWIRNKGQCAVCGSRKDLQYDYIQLISEGGNNTLDNLQLLCKTCIQEKSGANN